jgi:ubiquinone/menaquinone biosynthesis C-methylase UbiE
MTAPSKPEEILDVNRRYHDAAAGEYDGKWGISFEEIGRAQVLGKVEKLLGSDPGPFGRSLEIGAGTGYFTLNLMQAGVVREAVCTDISPGMLRTLEGNAQRLGLSVETVACDATELPFEDGSFDLVLNLFSAIGYWGDDGDLQALREFRRVLRPGGRAVVETMHRDRLARIFRPTDWQDVGEGDLLLEAREFDQLEGVVNVTFSYRPHAREPRTVRYAMRAYTATELVRLLRAAGFDRVEAFGGYDGSPFTFDSRLLAVAS